MFNYRPLWETMKAKGVSQYRLIKGGIDRRTLADIKKGKAIKMSTLAKLCKIIGCTPNDVVEIVLE